MSGKKKGAQREDYKEEEILQAIVIADSFNVRFAPVTQERPRALLPLVNVPLLDYTLEFLCSGGIEQIIIFCSIHAQQIKQHIRKSKWSSSTSPCEITIIVSEDCRSLGDALRDIDAKSLIKSDFVLVNGDIVANLKLKPILEQHRQRRLKMKTPVMTMLFKNAPPGHRTRCREEEVMVAVSPDNQRVLHYEKVGSTKKFDFALSIFQENSDVQLRYDLLDTHISICSPLVPCLFTDNFDYSTRDDFVKGILVNEEILGNTIHVYVSEDEYAARVSNLHMYDAISKDVISRWSYPQVPDGNMSHQEEDRYMLGHHNVYTHKDVTLARGCVLQENVVIGKGTTIGSNTHISNSIIGKNCVIGENVRIEGAYLWDRVHINDGCVVQRSLLADDVIILPNVTVQPGCVLSFKVKVGSDVRLPLGTMLMSEPPQATQAGVEDEFDDLDISQDEIAAVEVDPALVGAEGLAYVYSPPADSDDEDDLVQDMWGLTIVSDDEPEVSDSEDEMDDPDGDLRRSPVVDDTKVFQEEVLVTLERALQENIGFDNMVLEINSLKHAYNIQIREVNLLVTKAICQIPLRENPSIDSAQYLNKFRTLLKRMIIPLLKNYIKSKESQENCLQALEESSLGNAVIAQSLMKILHVLYDQDILSEEVLLVWYANPSSGTEDMESRKKLRKQVEPFIVWLEEAEEESEDDD